MMGPLSTPNVGSHLSFPGNMYCRVVEVDLALCGMHMTMSALAHLALMVAIHQLAAVSDGRHRRTPHDDSYDSGS